MESHRQYEHQQTYITCYFCGLWIFIHAISIWFTLRIATIDQMVQQSKEFLFCTEHQTYPEKNSSWIQQLEKKPEILARKWNKRNADEIKNADVRETHALNSQMKYPNINVCHRILNKMNAERKTNGSKYREQYAKI